MTKELLSKILGVTVHKVEQVDSSAIYYEWGYLSNDINGTDINIYELAHKCKEWAWNEYSVRIESGRMYGVSAEIWNAVISVYNGHIFYVEDSEHWEESDNEPEAIFKACQWILDNKDIG